VTARTTLEHRAADLDRVGARELAFLAQLDVRVDPTTAGVLGFPTEPNTWTRARDRDVLWLGPDEWLVVAEPGRAAAIAEELERSLADIHRSVVDVSANRAVLELSGSSRLDHLSSACPIDLHPRSWGDRRCAQSVFGAALVLLQERRGTTRLFVRPSFAGYVVDLLLAVAPPDR
jgi:sarcosine oxidase, subunit gamma